jgi:hypothetical protein
MKENRVEVRTADKQSYNGEGVGKSVPVTQANAY